ncbi:MAG: DNA repair protein RadA [bacterium]
MAARGSRFVCQQCAHEALAWSGRCAGCGEWNTLVETARAAPKAGKSLGGRSRAKGAARRPVALREVETPAVARLRTRIAELDRVLGGGFVPGSLVLLGGSPGIGKSTLTGMALGNLAAEGGSVLYVSGEESAAQVRLRAERLGPSALAVPVIAETSLEQVLATLEQERPEVCVIDSIQTMHAEGMTGAPGSVGQVREAATAIMEAAKRLGCAVVLVGHVTKEGAVAGPRVLEHLVDCVLFFEGERERSFRTLRALKNRFGATSEVGVFEMRAGGLVEVEDASARFVGEASAAPGSVVLCAMEGTRPLLVEVQALVAPTEIVPPRRICTGIDRNRLAMVLAVLARHGGPTLASGDVFVNVAGGVRVDEPGADLAVALALASAHRGEALLDGDGRPLACFGEIGLTGELRHVAHADRRVAEAVKFGLSPVLGPAAGERVEQINPAATLRDALKVAGARGKRAQVQRAA